MSSKHYRRPATGLLLLSRLAFVPLAFGLLCFVAGCWLNEFRRQEERLTPLVQRRAAKQEIVSLFGNDFIPYSKGRTNWEHLIRFLGQEPTNRLVGVRQRVAKWPNVMLYSTPSMMTWVFLDEDDRVVDFVVGAQ